MATKSDLEQAEASARLLIENLLSNAKAEIVSAEQVLAVADETATQHYRAAADRIADAQKQGASQRKIAKEVGKSLGWVNRLQRWRKEGYLDSPFGPQSSAARLRKKKRSGATEQHHNGSASPEKNGQADGEGGSAKANKDKMAEAKAEARKAKAEAEEAKAEAEKWKARAKAQAASSGASVAANVEAEDRDRLVKLLGMLGSDQDGECVSAARKAEKLRKRLGLTWNDLIVPAQVRHARAA